MSSDYAPIQVRSCIWCTLWVLSWRTKKLRRAGLDYHEWANVQLHENWMACRQALTAMGVDNVVAMTTKLSKPFYDKDFSDLSKVALVFGSETAGLSEEVRHDIGANNWLRLPMLPQSRSLNLSNSVAICLFEVWRQFGFVGDIGQSVGFDNLVPYDPK